MQSIDRSTTRPRIAIVAQLMLALLAGARVMAQGHTMPAAPSGGSSLGPNASIELARAAIVPLRLVDGARATVDVMVNGKGPYVFAIETGGPYGFVLDEKVARAAALPSATGATMPGARAIDSLRIGGLVFHSVVAATRNGTGVPGVDGMLGLEVYRELLLTIDYPQKAVRFERGALPEVNGRDIVPMRRISTRLYSIDATQGARHLGLVLDTQGGGMGISCAPGIADSLQFAATPAVIGQARVGGVDAPPRPTTAARVNGDIQFGGITLQRPLVGIFPLPDELGCLVGIETLKHFAITLDQQTLRVRFQGASTVAAPPTLYGFGVGILPTPDGRIVVASVSAGGSAEQAGLKAGDEISDINGSAPGANMAPTQVIREWAQTGKPLTLAYRRDGQVMRATLTPTVLVR